MARTMAVIIATSVLVERCGKEVMIELSAEAFVVVVDGVGWTAGKSEAVVDGDKVAVAEMKDEVRAVESARVEVSTNELEVSSGVVLATAGADDSIVFDGIGSIAVLELLIKDEDSTVLSGMTVAVVKTVVV